MRNNAYTTRETKEQRARRVSAGAWSASRLIGAFDRHGIDIDAEVDDDGFVNIELNSVEANEIIDFLNGVADRQRPVA